MKLVLWILILVYAAFMAVSFPIMQAKGIFYLETRLPLLVFIWSVEALNLFIETVRWTFTF